MASGVFFVLGECQHGTSCALESLDARVVLNRMTCDDRCASRFTYFPIRDEQLGEIEEMLSAAHRRVLAGGGE